MTAVQHRKVGQDEGELRLDRWFRRHFPDLGHGRLSKLLRTGQIRVDGKRAQPGLRIAPGQTIRIPPMPKGTGTARPSPSRPKVAEQDRKLLLDAILYQDDHIIAINKPSGLAVQGGSKIARHLDGMLDVLAFDAGRPRLVHRLDKDTSGVLLLARTGTVAARLATGFRNRDTIKVYWALVAGAPRPAQGRIDVALAKRGGEGHERVVGDPDKGKPALTEYATLETIGNRAAWLELRPLTGRTHQLRSHCMTLGTPIVGDGKYGGAQAQLIGLANRVHLHARSITIKHPMTGKSLRITAPLGGYMAASWSLLGLPERAPNEPRKKV
ncbi:MAG: RluA family pseudouridine synthase [Alphaproteobacteria bacterium]